MSEASTSGDLNLKPPTIEPIADGEPRPFWSVMIPTYNCASYLRETLASVLAQDPGPEQMQIEVIDDCSTKDDPAAVVEQLGQGRVAFYRQPQNNGISHNFTTCVRRARGQWVHILHGDDMVLPGFYATVRRRIEAGLNAGMVFTRAQDIDEKGQLLRISERVKAFEVPSCDVTPLFYTNPIRTPTVVVKRTAYEAAGGFLSCFSHVADWEQWVRIIATSGGCAIDTPLAAYRMSTTNDTSRQIRTANQLREMLALSEQFGRHFSNFDLTRQRCVLANTAWCRSVGYAVQQDDEAAAANSKFLNELSRFLPWRQRLLLLARRGKRWLKDALTTNRPSMATAASKVDPR